MAEAMEASKYPTIRRAVLHNKMLSKMSVILKLRPLGVYTCFHSVPENRERLLGGLV